MKSQLRLGIFIAVTFAAAAGAIFLIGSNRLLFTHTYRLYADFANVAGLEGGAPVQVAGLQQGSVTNIFLPKQAGQPVRVEMRLKGATRGVIKLDSAATINTEGLVGGQYIEISMGSPPSPSVRNGDTIPGKTPAQIAEIITHAQTVLDRMNGAIGNLTDITGKIDRGEGTIGGLVNNPSIYRHFDQAAGNLAGITGKLNNGQGTLGALLNDPSAYRHIDQAAGNLADVTGKLNDGKGTLGAMLNDRSLYEHLNGAVGNVDALTGKINSGQGTLGQLVNDPSLYTNVNRTAENLQDDSEALKHNFFLRGYFNHRGYEDEGDLARYAIPALPPGPPAERFDLPGAHVFKSQNEATIKQTKLLDKVGKFLQSHPFSLAVVATRAGMEGDTDTARKLTEARAYIARRWLVNHFPLDDTRIKMLGMGKSPEVPPTGELSVLIYNDGGAAEANAAERANPPTAAPASATNPH